MKVHTEECKRSQQSTNSIYRLLDKWLVGKKSSDSALYSEKWQQEFIVRPTWCDADMALQQINRGLATGNRAALYARSFFQSLLFALGSFIQNWAWPVVVIGLGVYLLCSFGLQYVHIETDLMKLWVSQGGRLDEELNFLSRVQQETQLALSREKRIAITGNTSSGTSDSSVHIEPVDMNDARISEIDTSRGSAFGNAFQVLIQTPAVKGTNALTKESLLKHVQIMEEIAKFNVEMFGERWTLADICFKPPSPNLPLNPFTRIFMNMLSRLIPCIWITPIDCFWEGSKPLGPSPPLNFGPDARTFVSSLPNGNVTWKNLNPWAVMKEVATYFDLGSMFNLFERSGIGSAYMDRWCIDPLDPECPSTAPNAFNQCLALQKFEVWNAAKPVNERIELEVENITTSTSQDSADPIFENLFGRKRRKREERMRTAKIALALKLTNLTESTSDDYYAYEDGEDYVSTNVTIGDKQKAEKEALCSRYGKGLLKWMRKNEHLWSQFLTKNEMPVYPDYGEIMTGGCQGFARKTMIWPEDLIIGGVKRLNHKLISAEAFQSVILVASANDIYMRFKDPKPDIKPNLDVRSWNPYSAGEIVSAWQRNFTERIYQHRWNTDVSRQVHPLSSTSLEDMLKEFSQFKFLIIFVGYFLMFIYAGWSQLRWDGWWFAVDSGVGLSILGVFVVTYASIAGLGVSSYLGIHFNAATTQIVPFLTLGLGVDDMFLLLHNYHDILHTVKSNEIGCLMKETGMSIVITSINNIIAFMAGTLLPIPALRSFCSQTAILLAFNMVAIMIIYPSLIALDLRRRRAGQRDLGCCCVEIPAGAKKLGVESLGIIGGKQNVEDLSVARNVYPGPPVGVVLKNTGYHTDDREDKKWYTLQGFLRYYYIPFMSKPLTKLIVILGCSSMFLFGCLGLYQSTLGLELSDVLPEGTAPAAFLRAREQYFSFYPMYAVLKGAEIDFPEQQMQIEQYRLDIGKSKYVIKVNGVPSEKYWMSVMRSWLASIQPYLDSAIKNGDINAVTGEIKPGSKLNMEAKIARRLVCSYGNNYNCTGRINKIKLVSDTGLINPDGFYNYLTAWFNIDNMMYYVSQASFYPLPPFWELTVEEKVVPPAQPPAYSQIPFYLTDLVDTPMIVMMIRVYFTKSTLSKVAGGMNCLDRVFKFHSNLLDGVHKFYFFWHSPVFVTASTEIRGICERYTKMGLPTFPYGIAFTFWEQYLHLRWNLFIAICVIASAVFIVISLLIFNPWAALMVMIVVVSMTIELAGFMGATGVKLNPVSAVTLITAVGIGVEFTAHVMLAYLTSLGTNNERMAACIEHMFAPVMHGGLSTLLGILMLAFSEFEFIVKYFFFVLSTLILIGLINGLMLLPVLLSLIGPPSEIYPVDGKTYLPVPPSLSKQQQGTDSKNSDDLKGVRVRGSFVEMQVNGSKVEDSNDHYSYHDSLSTIVEESSNGSSHKPSTYVNKFIMSPTNTLTSERNPFEIDNGKMSTTIPVGMAASTCSKSPVWSNVSANSSNSRKWDDSDSVKQHKFTSNALRL